MSCPRGYSNRLPSAVNEYENGFFCACVIPEKDAPPNGAPADIIKHCIVVRPPQKATKDDAYRREIDEMRWLTPSEALVDGHILLAAAYDWMNKCGLVDIFLSHAKYKKFKKGLSQAKR